MTMFFSEAAVLPSDDPTEDVMSNIKMQNTHR